MKVKMLTRIEGTRNGKRWPEAGVVIDLPEGEARDLVTNRVAEVAKEPAPEKPAPEVATARKATTRRKP